MESFKNNQYEDLLESVRDLPLIFSLGVVIGEEIPELVIQLAKDKKPKNRLEKLQITAAYHHHQILKIVPSKDRSLVSQINIGFQPTRILNAFADHDRHSGTFSITLNSSLDIFLNQMSILFFNLTNPTLNPGEKVRLVQSAIPQLSSMMFVKEKETYSQPVGLPRTQWYLHFVILSSFVMRFIVAHEIGHILEGHTERPRGDSASWSPVYLFHRRREETEADNFACHVIIENLRSIKEGRKPLDFSVDYLTTRDLGLVAPIVFFLLLHRLNNLHGNEERDASTHPTDKMRLDRFKEIVGQRLSPKYKEYVAEIEEIWETVENMSINESPEPGETDSHDLYLTLINSAASELSIYNYESAMSYARKAIRLKPSKCNAYELLAIALSESGRKKEGIDILRKLVREIPDNAELYYNLAVDLLHVGEVTEAMACFERVCEIEPENSAALEKLLKIYIERKAGDHVLRIARKLLPLSQDNDRNLYYIAEAFVEYHKYEEALSCLQRALELSPGDEFFQIMMSDVLSLMGRHTEAVKQFKKVTRIRDSVYGNNAQPFDKIDNMMASEEYNEAIELIRQYLEVHGDDPKLLSRLLFCYVGSEQYEAGIETGEKLVTSGKADVVDLVMLGQALLALGETEKAEEYFEEAVIQSENSINELLSEEYALRKMTIEVLAGAYFYLGNCSFERGEHQEALNRWQRSVDLLPNEDTVGNLLFGYLKTNNLEKLIDTGLEAIRGGLEGPGIFYNLACAYAHKEEVSQAVTYLQKAKAFDAKVAELAREDDSFVPIRDDDLFKAFLNSSS